MKKANILCLQILCLALLFSCAQVEFLENNTTVTEKETDRSQLRFVYDSEAFPPKKPSVTTAPGGDHDLTTGKKQKDPIDVSKLVIHPSSLVANHKGYVPGIIHMGQSVTSFAREYTVSFPDPLFYNSVEGILSFRGNNYRNTATYGTAVIKEAKLEIVWEKPIGYIDTWTGVGWTGQPALVKWPVETKNIMNINVEKKQKENRKC